MTNSTLRQTTRDLREAARELREEDIPDLEARREELVAEVRADYASAEDAPAEKHQEYQRLTQAIREANGTAETFEHYADAWVGESEPCEFVLEELNGDEYAATIDAVSAEARRQARENGDLPQGYGSVKALEYGVVDAPDGVPVDPGVWPAAIVNELFSQLEDITAPSEVGLGNESLSEALAEEDSDGVAFDPASQIEPPSETS